MRTSASKKIHRLIENFAPEIRDTFLESIRNITDTAVLRNIARYIEDGDINRAVHSLGLNEAAFRPFAASIERAFETGGIATAGTFPRTINTPIGETVFRFDVRNSRAEAWLREFSSGEVVKITEEARAVVRSTIQAGVAEGRNGMSIAYDITGRINPATGRREGGIIGLAPNQEQWVRNARRDLARAHESKSAMDSYLSRARRDARFDSIVKRANRDGKPIDPAQIDKLVNRYKDGLLKYRGEVIGRTEANAALEKAEIEAINQAVEQGAVRASAVKRVWDATGDSRTRPDHMEMEGQTVGLNEPFTFPDGSQAMFPGDTSLGAPGEQTIQCRCVARVEINWFDDVKEITTQEERDALLALSEEELFGGR